MTLLEAARSTSYILADYSGTNGQNLQICAVQVYYIDSYISGNVLDNPGHKESVIIISISRFACIKKVNL